MAWPIFLSCLCGSELNTLEAAPFGHFLSCLCGSEQKPRTLGAGRLFLSCLCGSELVVTRADRDH